MDDGQKVYKSFQDLAAWQKARTFKLNVYEVLKAFPSEEKFSLTDQLRRSVRSVPANISEGYGRYTYKDQIHFCIQARGSLTETHNHLIDATDCAYISKEILASLEIELESVEKTINGYIAWLRRMMQSAK